MTNGTALADRPAKQSPDDLIALTRAQIEELQADAFRAGMLAQARGYIGRRPLAATG